MYDKDIVYNLYIYMSFSPLRHFPVKTVEEWMTLIQEYDKRAAENLVGIVHRQEQKDQVLRMISKVTYDQIKDFVAIINDGSTMDKMVSNVVAFTAALFSMKKQWIDIRMPCMIPVLVKYGWDPNMPGPDEATLLIINAVNGLPDMVEALLEYKADTTLRDASGRTAYVNIGGDALNYYAALSLPRWIKCRELIKSHTSQIQATLQPILETGFSSDVARSVAKFIV